MRGIVYLMFIVILTACSALTPPTMRFPQLNERAIVGPGKYDLPRWSPDGKFIAFIERDTQDLCVYELASGKTWIAAAHSTYTYFDWDPNGRLTYLKYRPELSGSPFPIVNDLHLVERDGNNDHTLVPNLHSPGVFAWLPDNKTLIILLATRSEEGRQDIYLLDTATNTRKLLLRREDMNVDSITYLAFSTNKRHLLVYAHRIEPVLEPLFFVYDLESDQIIKEVEIQKWIGDANYDEYHPATVKDTAPTFVQVGNHEWIVTGLNAPKGDCQSQALYFFNVDDPNQSFCIPAKEPPVIDPVLSPDLSKIAIVSPVNMNTAYLMLVELTAEYRARLER